MQLRNDFNRETFIANPSVRKQLCRKHLPNIFPTIALDRYWICRASLRGRLTNFLHLKTSVHFAPSLFKIFSVSESNGSPIDYPGVRGVDCAETTTVGLDANDFISVDYSDIFDLEEGLKVEHRTRVSLRSLPTNSTKYLLIIQNPFPAPEWNLIDQ